MAVGKGNALRKKNISPSEGFNSAHFKPNVTGKPLAHKFDLDAHPNRIPLDFTNNTGDGITVKLGDLIHVDEQIPVEAIVTSIVQRKNSGKIYVTGTLKDESVRSWPSTMVRFGPIDGTTELTQKQDPIDYDWMVKDGLMTEHEVALLKAQYEKDPTLFDHTKGPKKGTIRTWNVRDKLKGAGEVLYFARSLKPPYGWLVEHTSPGGEMAKPLEDMWQHIPPAPMKRVGGRHKTWVIGNHVRFGHGKHEELGQVKYLVIDDHRKPYAVVEVGHSLVLIPVDQLYPHRLEPQYKPERPVVKKKVEPVVKKKDNVQPHHDVHYVEHHPQKSHPPI